MRGKGTLQPSPTAASVVDDKISSWISCFPHCIQSQKQKQNKTEKKEKNILPFTIHKGKLLTFSFILKCELNYMDLKMQK